MKTCLMCGGSLAGKRDDSKFCSSSCKAKHHLQKDSAQNDLKGFDLAPGLKKTESKPLNIKTEPTPLEPLLNLVGSSDAPTDEKNNTLQQTEKPTEILLPAKYVNRTVRENNPNYTIHNKQLIQCRADIANVETAIKKVTELIAQEKGKNGSGLYLASAGSGALLGYNIKSQQKGKSSDNSFLYTVLGGLLGLGLGRVIDEATAKDREKSKQLNIEKYEKQKADHQKLLQDLKQMEKQISLELSKHPPIISKELNVLNPAYLLIAKYNEEQKIKEQKRITEINGIHKDQSVLKKTGATEDFESDKITSMKKLSDMKFSLLNFQGRWLNFFGLPQTNFFCVVHGMSGEGKSHFAMQFAKYLAETFGRVLYVSGEEGFAPTFQQKVNLLGADTIPNLYAGNIRTGKELLNEVPNNKFHFIVIDSLNNMNIDPEIMRQIRSKFKHSAIIAICQNTKDGKVRGSYEIMHDSDMIVRVANGIAETIKNRFKEKNMQFDVFEVLRKKENKVIPINRKNDKEDSGMDTDLRNTI